jgi:hypothetical protein
VLVVSENRSAVFAARFAADVIKRTAAHMFGTPPGITNATHLGDTQSQGGAAGLGASVPTLCCGLKGQAVALHRYAEVSGDTRFARRADAPLLRAIRSVEANDDVPLLGLWGESWESHS